MGAATTQLVLAMIEAWGPVLASFFVQQLQEGKINDKEFQAVLDRASRTDERFRAYVEDVKREMADASGEGGG